jgi:predicted O-methyltransferase YrrM
LHVDCQRFLRFLANLCIRHREEFMKLPRTRLEGHDEFFVTNPWFGPFDAEVLYSALRTFRPATVMEVGSGFSTLLIRRAISDGDLATRLLCIDPMPRVDIRKQADEHVQRRVEELDPSELAHRLGANDILFIDSSHTVNAGGDVPYLFLEVLPRLAPGVLVHIHDIFLPFDYPKEWVVDYGWNWNEQYLVGALLYANNAVELLWPAHYMWRCHREELREIIPSEPSLFGPSSLWLRKLT